MDIVGVGANCKFAPVSIRPAYVMKRRLEFDDINRSDHRVIDANAAPPIPAAGGEAGARMIKWLK